MVKPPLSEPEAERIARKLRALPEDEREKKITEIVAMYRVADSVSHYADPGMEAQRRWLGTILDAYERLGAPPPSAPAAMADNRVLGDDDREWFTVMEAARYLGISDTSVRQRLDQHERGFGWRPQGWRIGEKRKRYERDVWADDVRKCQGLPELHEDYKGAIHTGPVSDPVERYPAADADAPAPVVKLREVTGLRPKRGRK